MNLNIDVAIWAEVAVLAHTRYYIREYLKYHFHSKSPSRKLQADFALETAKRFGQIHRLLRDGIRADLLQALTPAQGRQPRPALHQPSTTDSASSNASTRAPGRPPTASPCATA